MFNTGISLSDIKTYGFKGSFSQTIDVDVIKRYNKELLNTKNSVTAYYRAMSDGNGNIIQCNKARRDLIASQNGAMVSTEALKKAQITASESGKKLTGVMKTLKGALINFGIMLAIEGIIALVKFTQETFFPTVKQLKEELSETTQEIADLHSEQESLNSELETTRQRIAELKAQGTLTFTEEAELTRLQKENAELERKLELTKANKAASESEFEGDFLDAFNSDYGDKATFNYQGRRNLLDKLADALLEGSETRFTAEEYTNDLFVSYEKALGGDKAYEHNLDKYKERINDVYEDYQGYLKQLEDADYSYGTNEQIDAYIDQINEFNDKYLVAFGNTENLFSQIVNRDKFSEAHAAIKDLGDISQESLLKLYNENDKVKELINYLLTLGQVDWQSILGNKRFGELDEDGDGVLTKLELFDEKTGECKVTSEQFSQAMSGVANELNKVEEAAEGAANSMSEFIRALSAVQKLDNGLNQLDEIYADILDGKDFDFGSILNNEDFTTAFGSLGDVYDDFIKTVANSPSDINACQNAFDNLVTAYLNNSDALKQVTADTKNATIAMLKQKGIANATAIVEEQLAINEEKATIQKKLQKDVYEDSSVTLQDFIDQLYNEADATDITREAYINLIAQETIFNNKNLDVTQKIEELERLAKQAGLTSQAIASIVTPTSALEKKGANVNDIAKQREEWLKNAGISWKKVGTTKNKAGAKVEDWVYTYNGKQYENFDSVASAWYANLFASNTKTSYTKISYSGGSSTKSVRDSGKTAEEKRKEEIEKHKEAAEAEIAKLKYKLETNQITEEQYLKELDSAYKHFYNKTADYLEDYAKYSQEVYDGFKDMYKEDLEADKKALEEKKEAITEYYDELIEKIQDTHDEEDYEKEQSKKRKEIFDIDMQIAELMRDGSEKAKARIAELEEERLKAEEEYRDFETDKARKDEIERLEKEREAREKEVQEKIDSIDTKLDSLDTNTKDIRNAVIQYAKAKGVDIKFAYASGTRSSVGGFGRINEKGIEMISAPDGNGNYVNLMPDSYVFSAKATEFLWKLATEHSLPQAMYNSIAKSIKTQSSTPSVNIAQPITITMGDIIIKGNADKQTVADIKKQQENTVRMVLQKIKELQK